MKFQTRDFATACEEDHSGADICTSVCGKGMLKQVYREGLQPMGGTHVGPGEKCEKKGVAEKSCYGSHSLSLLGLGR